MHHTNKLDRRVATLRALPLALPLVRPLALPLARPLTNHRSGFSLIEMVVVLLIIGMLVSAVAYNVLGQSEDAKIKVTQRNLVMVKGALETYFVTKNALPTNLQTLVTTGTLSDNSFKDEWKRDLQFSVQSTNPTRPFLLWSLGKDGVPGTEDDLDAWLINSATINTPNQP